MAWSTNQGHDDSVSFPRIASPVLLYPHSQPSSWLSAEPSYVEEALMSHIIPIEFNHLLPSKSLSVSVGGSRQHIMRTQ